MPQCTHCGHNFAVSEDFRCPECAEDWRGPPEPATAQPAHLALLNDPAAQPPRMPKKRIVSSAGPSVPVLPAAQNDSVPSGWMARLEAAKVVARGESGVHAAPVDPTATPTAPSTPPPLKAALRRRDSNVSAKPAHLLVAQLERDEHKRQTAEQARLSELFNEEEPEEMISKVEVDLPEAPKKKKRLPDWVVVGTLGLLVLGGVGFAYSSVQKEPAPTATVDPALAKKAALRKKAMAALEQGHTLALEGTEHSAEAITAYESALKLEPNLASAERGLAIVYAAKGEQTQAVQHYRRYLELSPEARDAPQVRAIVSGWEKSQRKKRR